MSTLYSSNKNGKRVRKAELDLFHPEHIEVIARCFGQTDRFNRFGPSVCGTRGWLSMFAQSERTGRVILLHARESGKGRAKTTKAYDLDFAYARYHGYAVDEIRGAMALMYRRKLLHDSLIRPVPRQPFRKPNETFRELLFPAGQRLQWIDTVAYLDGLGLAQDLHDHPLELTLYTPLFSARWNWHRFVYLPNLCGLRALLDDEDHLIPPVDRFLFSVRRNLSRAGLIRFEGRGYKTRYGIHPPGEDPERKPERGLTRDELLRLW